MKKTNVFVFGLIVLTVAGFTLLSAGASFAACPTGINAYWKLDEAAGPTYFDFIGDNDGTGAADPVAATGAQSFNGTSMAISVDPSKTFNWLSEDSFTIEFWVRVVGGIPANTKVVVSRNDLGTLFWYVGISSGTGFATVQLNDTGTDSSTLTGTTDIATDGQWHHVALVRDESTNTNYLYVDGDQEDFEVVDYAAGFSSDAAELLIGRLLGPVFANSWFNGLIDEVAIYDRALPEAEIDAHVAAGAGADYCGGSAAPTAEETFAPFPDDTISLWKLDEPAGASYLDAFGENDGTGAADPLADTGRVAGAQSFNGTSMAISVDPSRTFNWLSEDSFTIEFWVSVIGGIPANTKVVVSRNDLGTLFWYAGISSGTGFATVQLNDTGAGTSTLTGTTDIATDGQWHHVALVRDESTDTNYLYVDGDQEDFEVVDYAAGFSSDAAELLIGRLLGPVFTSSWFNGLIDEVALYDRALPESEIDTHVDAGMLGNGVYTLRPAPPVVNPPVGGGGGGGGGGCFISSMF